MGVIEFFGSLFFFVWFTSAIFWAIACVAFASWARIDFKFAIPAGLIFQGLGLVGLLIFYFVKKLDSQPSQAFGASANSVGSYDPFGSPGGATFESSGFATSGFNQFDSADKRYVAASGWLKSAPGGFVGVSSVLVIGLFIWSLFLTWFNIITPGRESTGRNAFSTGLDFWVFITEGLIIGAILLMLKKPSLVSAVMLALAGTWWLMLSTASLTARDVFVPAIDHLFQIPDLIVSADSVTKTWAYDIGTAWYVVFLNAILLIAASCIQLYSANRARA